MDGGQLHRLGRRLIELSRTATTGPGDPAMNPAEVAVLEAVLTRPDSTVSDISARTGFAQSHVSVSIARLSDRGVVTTNGDPADRRRSRIRPTDGAVRAITNRAARPIDATLAEALADPQNTERVIALLDELSGLLLPATNS